MRICVFGSSGFIGSHLVRRLLADGHEIIGYSQTAYRPRHAASSGSYRHIRGDFTTEADLAGIVGESDICFHLVSTTNPGSAEIDPAGDVEANLLPTIRLAQHLATTAPKTRLIFVSSGGTLYGNSDGERLREDAAAHPVSAYGAAKLAAETYIRLFGHTRGLPFLIIRPSNLYGPPLHGSPFGLIHKVMGQIRRGEDVDVWGDGRNIRDYLHIDDFVDFLSIAAAHPTGVAAVNVGTGVGHSILDVIGLLEDALGRRAGLRYHPARAIDVRRNVLDVALAGRVFGWSARTALADGIRAMVAYSATDD